MNNVENLKDLIIYQSQNNENISVEVLYNDEDFWLTQKSMAELFNVEVNTINYHLKEIFKSKELDEETVIQKIRITANDGKKYNTNFYSLDAIIAVGYRVNSKEATDFRIWATKTLKEYIKKGFVLNSELLKNGPKFGKDYFDELLVKIKEIRASERRFYQKITDIFKECSYDYDKNSEVTGEFYKNVQNKLHFAITGMTAPEIIYNRVDSNKKNMGLTTWKNAPDGKILETDVTVAKNYLDKEEIEELNNLVSMYLDYAERQVKLGKIISMKEWKDKLEVFLKINEYNILEDNGKIKREIANKLALDEYKKYRVVQDEKYISDFDELLIESKDIKNNEIELAREEERITKLKAIELFETKKLEEFEVGTFQGLAQIHKYLFEEIYEFAGIVRTENISKNNFRFASSMYLEDALKNIDKMPQSNFDEIIEKYIEMNIAHPFREGNGRSTRIWLDMILKKEIGKVIDWSKINKEDYLLAMEKSPIKDTELKFLLKEALTEKVYDREVYMKGIDASYRYEGYNVYRAEDLKNN